MRKDEILEALIRGETVVIPATNGARVIIGKLKRQYPNLMVGYDKRFRQYILSLNRQNLDIFAFW